MKPFSASFFALVSVLYEQWERDRDIEKIAFQHRTNSVKRRRRGIYKANEASCMIRSGGFRWSLLEYVLKLDLSLQLEARKCSYHALSSCNSHEKTAGYLLRGVLYGLRGKSSKTLSRQAERVNSQYGNEPVREGTR